MEKDQPAEPVKLVPDAPLRERGAGGAYDREDYEEMQKDQDYPPDLTRASVKEDPAKGSSPADNSGHKTED